MIRLLVLTAAVAALGGVLAAEPVQVDVRPGGIRVVAERSSLASVLEELSRQTHTQLTYDGPAPDTLVSVAIDAASPMEAFVRLIEGMGVSYAAAVDVRTGGLKSVLVVTGANARGGGSSSMAGTGSAIAPGADLPEGYSEIAQRPVRGPEAMSPPAEQNEVEEPPARQAPRGRDEMAGGDGGDTSARGHVHGRPDRTSRPPRPGRR